MVYLLNFPFKHVETVIDHEEKEEIKDVEIEGNLKTIKVVFEHETFILPCDLNNILFNYYGIDLENKEK